ncbi:hypothetical protein AB6A40_002356 [Gnathostoma spinigerum]|uniref:Rootletin-like coiled-coil domain-containing protein n=1 Tax=Gnathostoma spinigerum TaxID=75299 RepID=A0ABD6EG28_9BILA
MSEYYTSDDDPVPCSSHTIAQETCFTRESSNLNSCKTRIDANVEEQRKYREVLAGLNSKVRRYRQKAAETSNQLSNLQNHSTVTVDLSRDSNSSLLLLAPCSSTSHFASAADGIAHSILSPTVLGSPLTRFDDRNRSSDLIMEQLRDEQARNNTLEEVNCMLREQSEAAVQANRSLTEDLARANEKLQQMSRERELERSSLRVRFAKNRSLLDSQHQNMLELWSCLKRFRRDMRDLRTETENDLDRQKTELVRLGNNMENIIRDAELKRRTLSLHDEKNDEALEDLLRKYEELAVRNLKTEHQYSESMRKVSELESRLVRVSEDRDCARDSLKRLQQLPEVVEARGRRARSISPNGIISSVDTVRLIRNVIQTKNDEIRKLTRRLDEADERQGETKASLERAEETEKVMKKRIGEIQSELEIVKNEKDELERKNRQMEKKISLLINEKSANEQLVCQLHDQIGSLRQSHQTSVADLMKKSRDEMQEKQKFFDAQLEERDKELKQKVDKLRGDVEKWRTENEKTKEGLRKALADNSADSRKISDLELQLSESVQREKNWEEKNNELRQIVCSKNLTVSELEDSIERLQRKMAEIESVNRELITAKETLSSEKLTLIETVTKLKTELDDVSAELDQQRSEDRELQTKITTLMNEHREYETRVSSTTTVVEELQTKLEVEKGHLAAVEAENSTFKQQLEASLKEIAQLKAERNQFVDERGQVEDELQSCVHENEKIRENLVSYEKKFEIFREEKEKNEERIACLKKEVKDLSQSLSAATEHVESLEEKMQLNEAQYKNEISRLKDERTVIGKKNKDEENIKVRETVLKLEEITKEKLVIEKTLINAEVRLAESDRIRDELTEEIKRLRNEIEERRREAMKEIKDIKGELETCQTRYDADASDWSHTKSMMADELDKCQRQLRDLLGKSDEIRRDKEVKEEELSKRIEVLEKTLTEEKTKNEQMRFTLDEREEMTRVQLKQFDKEREEWSRTVNEEEEKCMRLKNEIEELKKQVSETDVKLRSTEERLSRKDEMIASLESEVGDLEHQLEGQKASEDRLKDRVVIMEREIIDLREQNEKMKTEWKDAVTESKDSVERRSACEKEVVSLKSRLEEQENMIRQSTSIVKKLQSEKEKLEHNLTSIVSDSQNPTGIFKQRGELHRKLADRLEEEKAKTSKMNAEIESMRVENERLKKEITFVKEAMEHKSDTSQKALDDILTNYRKVENDRAGLAKEKEILSRELDAMRNRLRITETKCEEVQQKLHESESLQQTLQQRLSHFENSAKKVLSYTKPRSPTLLSPTSPTFIGLDTSSPGGFYHLRSSTSSQEISSTHHHFNEKLNEVHGGDIDITSSVEITFKYLRNRIEELEKDKKQLIATLNKLKNETNRMSDSKREAMRKVETLQKQVDDLEDARSTLESRLASSRQLMLIQEESLRSKEQERKTLKTRFVSTDLHSREKDARIISLGDKIAALNKEISAMEEKRTSTEQAQKNWEEEIVRLEKLQKETQKELEKCRTELHHLQTVNEKLMRRIDESERGFVASELRCMELEKVIAMYRKSCRNHQTGDDQERLRGNNVERSTLEHQLIVEGLQSELDLTVSKLKAMENDRDQLSRQLQEFKRNYDKSSKAVLELQHSLDEVNYENKSLRERIVVLEKVDQDTRSVERDLRKELDLLRTSSIKMTAESDDLKRRLHKSELERRELEAHRVRAERERAALKKHIETLELDKQHADEMSRKYSSEKQALDKSLTTMEKENMELYRNCSLLQAQVAELEKEQNARLSEDSLAQKRSLNNQLQRVMQEKRHIEAILDQREQAYLQKVKLYESRIMMLTDQLTSERRRRRTSAGRTTMGDSEIERLKQSPETVSSSTQRHYSSSVTPTRTHTVRTVTTHLRSHSISSTPIHPKEAPPQSGPS